MSACIINAADTKNEKPKILDVTKTGNEEWGNGEWGMGNGKLKCEIENGKLNFFLH